MEELMEHMVSGVSSAAQRAALAAIKGPQDCVAEMRGAYEEWHAIVRRDLNEIEGISCLLPEGTFYAFLNISRFGLSSWDLAKYLVKEYRVALVPGSIFGPKWGKGTFAFRLPATRKAYRKEFPESGKELNH